MASNKDIEVTVRLRDVPQFVRLLEAVELILIARTRLDSVKLSDALDELDTAAHTLRD